ncbi:MAG TPA: hypothetical protein VF297_32750 [Pyrinomonadaceae bacterium]
MRSYGYKHSTDGGKRKTGWERTELYSTREATEWDVRVDVNAILTPEVVIGNIKERLDELSYVLVSGVERPDKESEFTAHGPVRSITLSKENHMHVCVVLFKPGKRGDVLQLIRGTRKLGDEYCAPRNAKFAYAGWVIHHGKPLFKIDGEPLIRYEHGTLPMDPFTEEVARRIGGLLKKWGTPEMTERFKGYTAILGDEKVLLRKQLERKQALVEKLQTEIFEIRVKLE